MLSLTYVSCAQTITLGQLFLKIMFLTDCKIGKYFEHHQRLSGHGIFFYFKCTFDNQYHVES